MGKRTAQQVARARWRYNNEPAFRDKERKRNRNRAWRRNKCGKYGITPTQLEALWHVQSGKCPLCLVVLETFRSGHVDHDHSTGAVRGILCKHCNVGLGMFKESPASMARAIGWVSVPKG